MLTSERLREQLHYDPETGVFTRARDSNVRRWRAGQIAGSVHSRHGYAILRFDGKDHLAHRVAWLYVTGEWPSGDVDHIDGNKINNRISNLRVVSETVNSQNQNKAHAGSKSGILGVYPCGNKWRSTICINKKPKYLGTFDTPEMAYAAYLKEKRIHHPGCTI